MVEKKKKEEVERKKDKVEKAEKREEKKKEKVEKKKEKVEKAKKKWRWRRKRMRCRTVEAGQEGRLDVMIWYYRNSLAHGSKLGSMDDVCNWSKAFLDDFIKANIKTGVVIQDYNGDVFASCSQTLLSNLNAKSANLIAILKSVQLSLDCGLALCAFESDNALVVKWINEAQCNFSENGVLLDDIKSLSYNIRKVKFVYTSSRAN
ncbi:hypothetical protein LWI29_004609 [Acer saccharum]|uniref:RNase H type-1 domain-containing protein n=1 Tax=Acer saccharum TaxID=4024 RepID=A0AA39RU10_ACESA|nr:hypothetical protein LWI29_004609 [Acer saccharum]